MSPATLGDLRAGEARGGAGGDGGEADLWSSDSAPPPASVFNLLSVRSRGSLSLGRLSRSLASAAGGAGAGAGLASPLRKGEKRERPGSENPGKEAEWCAEAVAASSGSSSC